METKSEHTDEHAGGEGASSEGKADARKEQAETVGSQEVPTEFAARVFAAEAPVVTDDTSDMGGLGMLKGQPGEAVEDVLSDEPSGAESKTVRYQKRGRETQKKPPEFNLSDWEMSRSGYDNERPFIEKDGTGGESLGHVLDKRARIDAADYWSDRPNGDPQEDAGMGAFALGEIIHSRTRKKTASQDPKPDNAEGSGRDSEKNESAEQIIVCEISFTGKGLDDVLDSVQRQDKKHGTNIAGNLVRKLVCPKGRAEVLLETGVFEGKDIEIIEFDPEDPSSLKLPAGTEYVTVDGVTNTMETHQLYRLENGGETKAVKRHTAFIGNAPILTANESEGIGVSHPINWNRTTHSTAKDKETVGEYIQPLQGRVAERLWTITEPSTTPLEGTPLERQEKTVNEFMQGKSPGVVYNFAPNLPGFIASIAGQVGKDGLIMIGGHMRHNSHTVVNVNDLNSTHRVPLPSGEENDIEINLRTSPLETKVTETSQIREGMGTRDHRLIKIGEGGGTTYDYAIVDLSSDPKNTQEIIDTVVKGLTITDEKQTAGEVLRSVNRAIVFSKKTNSDPGDFLEGILKDAIESNPSLARDYGLYQDIAVRLRQEGCYDSARQFAEKASELLPLSAEPFIEIARTEQAQENYQAAATALHRAEQLAPLNPEVYDLEAQIARQQGDTEAEVHFLFKQLEVSGAKPPAELAKDLLELCDAAVRDAVENKDNQNTYKAIAEQDLETGLFRPVLLSEAVMKQIRAADTILQARDALQAIMIQSPSVTAQEFDETIEKFNTMWEAMCPRGPAKNDDEFADKEVDIFGDTEASDEEVPLSRELWPDRPQGNVRWIYSDRMAERSVGSQDDLLEVAKRVADNMTESTEVALSTDEYPEAKDIIIGEQLMDGHVTGLLSVTINDFRRSIYVVGASGSGKTVLVRTIAITAEQLGAKITLGDFANKEGLRKLYNELLDRGHDITVIEPGNQDIPPVSIDFFRPIPGSSASEHIGLISDVLASAYGLTDGLEVMLRIAASLTYSELGHRITDPYYARLMPPGKILKNPPIPRPRDFLKHFKKAGEIYHADARNLEAFWKQRCNDLEGPLLGPLFLAEGSHPLDWSVAPDKEFYYNLSRLTDPKMKAFAGNALDKFMFEATRRRGKEYGDEEPVLDRLKLYDEVGAILYAGGDPDSPLAKAADSMAKQLEIARGYGVGTVMLMQQDLAPETVRSQAGTKIAARQGSITYAESMGGHLLLDPTEIRELGSLKPGFMFVQLPSMDRAVKVRITTPPMPKKEDLDRGANRQVRPPVRTKDKHLFTLNEYNQVKRLTQDPKYAGIVALVGETVMASVAGKKLPQQASPQASERWERMKSRNPEAARLLVRVAVQQAVNSRIEALARHYPPEALGKSVVEIVEGLLNGEPTGEYASSAFIVPEVAAALAVKETTSPNSVPDPDPMQFATPAQGVPGVAPRIGERVKELRERVLRSPHSPRTAYGKHNAKIAYTALVGDHNVYNSLQEATDGEPDSLAARRKAAADTGYLSSQASPVPDEISEMFSVPKHLRDTFANA